MECARSKRYPCFFGTCAATFLILISYGIQHHEETAKPRLVEQIEDAFRCGAIVACCKHLFVLITAKLANFAVSLSAATSVTTAQHAALVKSIVRQLTCAGDMIW